MNVCAKHTRGGSVVGEIDGTDWVSLDCAGRVVPGGVVECGEMGGWGCICDSDGAFLGVDAEFCDDRHGTRLFYCI